MFCTGDAGEASNFGRVFQVIPVNHFNYTWSPRVVDANYKFSPEYIGVSYDDLDDQEWTALFDNMFFRGDDGSLRKAIASGHEIMIHCQNVLYIDTRAAQFSSLLRS